MPYYILLFYPINDVVKKNEVNKSFDKHLIRITKTINFLPR